jgi:hypothetical protein
MASGLPLQVIPAAALRWIELNRAAPLDFWQNGSGLVRRRGGAVSALAEARLGRFIERLGLAAAARIEGDWFVEGMAAPLAAGLSAERFKDW